MNILNNSFFALHPRLLFLCCYWVCCWMNVAVFAHPASISLYNDSVPVLQLNEDNFNAAVFTQFAPSSSSSPASNVLMPVKPAHLVEFYASWCGHCRNFAETWVRVAQSTKNWQRAVRVSAVNCASPSNTKLCSQHGITSYPKIKYFSSSATNESDGIVLPSVYSDMQVRRLLVDTLLNDFYSHGRIGRWLNFDSLPNTSDISQLWRLLSLNPVYTHMALIFEDVSENYIGIETLMDFIPMSWVYARRAKSNNPLASSLSVELFPTVIIFELGKNRPIYRSDFRQSVLSEVNDLLSSKNMAVLQPSTTTLSPATLTTPTLEAIVKRFVLSETDLLVATRYSLYDALASYDEISGDKLQALKNFVQLLSLYFPPVPTHVQTHLRKYGFNFPSLDRSSRAKSLLNKLSAHLHINDDRPITYDQWSKVFSALEAKHNYPFPINASYVHCRGSEPKYRGYSCGLWTLFHTLTVNAYYEEGNSPDFKVFWVLDSIKNYIKEFFACRECAEHFVDMVTNSFNIREFVQNAADVVLYLWNAHNIVNNRLKGLPSEDPYMPKLQFPAEFLCPRCRNETTNNNNEWLPNVVLHFMTSFYGSNLARHVENSEYRVMPDDGSTS